MDAGHLQHDVADTSCGSCAVILDELVADETVDRHHRVVPRRQDSVLHGDAADIERSEEGIEHGASLAAGGNR